MVPADKASNNVVVICKKYYIEVIIKELYNIMGSKSTYQYVTDNSTSIIHSHIKYMKEINVWVPSNMEELPCLYWLPKLHKTPFGSRFIAASNRCTTKPLSSLLTACLHTVTLHFKEYCNGIFRNSGINCFWIINNSLQVLSLLSTLNVGSKAKHLDSFDFATLYTNIPHDSLKCNLKELITEAFKVRGAKYLSVNRQGVAYWSIEPTPGFCFSFDKLIEMLEYLIDNIYIIVGNRVFQQHIGIPMGTDCALLIANLYLFCYEYNYMKTLMKLDYGKALKFNFTVRYIDDLLTYNNTLFMNEIPNIYPQALVLNRTTESDVHVSYLDINISIKQNIFLTNVYDKRDNFNFKIVNFPFLNSNIPTRPAYGVYMSQLVRIGRICCDYSSFVKRHYIMTSKLVKQGFWYCKLCRTFKRFYKNTRYWFVNLVLVVRTT